MKYKSVLLILGLVALFFIADSRFNLLPFNEKPSLSRVVECEAVNQVSNLEIALESEDPSSIAEGIRKMESRLRIALIFEPGPSGLGTNSAPVKASEIYKDIDSARKEFREFSKLSESEIPGKIPEIEASVKSVEESLKGYC